MTCKDCFHYGICPYNDNYDHHASSLCDHFKNKADVVEVKRGKWEKKTFILFDSEIVGYKCSECNTTWDTNTNYCPNCGAKMDGEYNG